jgi:alcohol dehydrogenase class IV
MTAVSMANGLVPAPAIAGGNGVLRLPLTIVAGPGQRRAIGHVTSGFARHVLICTDARLGEALELSEMVEDLHEAGVATHVFVSHEVELPVSQAVNCVESCEGMPVDGVVGFGGGSCLDLAKTVAVLLTHGGKPSDYFGEGKVPGPTLPMIAVPTTAGTGSEATPVAVLSDPDFSMKVGISSRHIIPAVAVVDPELTYTCPPELTAAAGIDALTHLVESFTAIRRPPSATLVSERVFIGKSDFTDGVALKGLSLMRHNLLAVYERPQDEAARHAVMLAALCGGVALGTAGTAAAHALQYPLGALTHTAHGAGTGCLLPYVMRFNLSARVQEYGEIARALGVDTEGLSSAGAAQAAVEEVDRLVSGLGIPATLEALGVTRDQIPVLAKQGLEATRLVNNNPRPLDLEAMTAIATAAFNGDRSVVPA